MTEIVVHELVTVTADEAGRLEEEFLNGLDQAQDAFVRIMETNAWAALGHDSFAAWWEQRVVPVMRALSMRPTREITDRVLERVRREEVALPAAQRRTQPHRLLADEQGNVIENQHARVKFKAAEAKRAQEDAVKAAGRAAREQNESGHFAVWAADELAKGRPLSEVTWDTCVRETGLWKDAEPENRDEPQDGEEP